MCRDNKCGDHNQFNHTMCIRSLAKDCVDFQLIPFRNSVKRAFVYGHNGIRNKIAMEWSLSSMNLLYWSNVLSEMAVSFLKKCDKTPDPCDYLLFRNISVGQNIIFLKGNPGLKWPARSIRRIYHEIGKIKTFEHFTKTKPSKISRLTQMIWPETKFVGCAAANLFDGLLVVCYYHPKSKVRDWTKFKRGTTCTECTHSNFCSIIFNNLCGIDIPILILHESTNLPSQSLILNFLCTLFIVILNY